jgi:hypothetical protein
MSPIERRFPVIRTLVIALVALSLSLPAAALARTDPPFDPGARTQGAKALTKAHVPLRGRTAGTSQAGHGQPASGVVVTSSGSGFDWGDAAIGAGVAIAAMAVAGGAFLAYRRVDATVRVPSGS